MEAIFNQIDKARTAQGLSIAQLYRQANLARPDTFKDIREGKIRMGNLIRICSVLGITKLEI